MAKKLTLSGLKNLQPQDIPGNKQMPKLRSMVKQARELYEKRVKALKKAHVSWSPALEKIEGKVGTKPVNKMSASSLQVELIRIQQFFQSRTSTAAGARDVMREQDASIFGVDYSGKPLFRMTKNERDMFWEAFEKYYETYGAHAQIVGSNQLKILLGNWVVQRRSGKQKPEEVGADILARLNEMVTEKAQYEWKRPEIPKYNAVFSGTWDDLAKGYTGKNSKHKK